MSAQDSAGATVAESTMPAWGEGEGWTVDASPIVDLAETGDGPDHEFFLTTDATRLPDGSFVVADDDTDEIRLFSPEGRYLRRMGRAGEGPGEFRRLDQVIALPGDSILAYDYWQARITVFGPEGEMVRVVTVEGAYRPRPLFPLGSGGHVGRSSDLTGFGEEPGLRRTPSHIVRAGEDGSVVDTLTTVPGFESVIFEYGDGRVLWGKDSHLAVHEDDVYVGSADSLEYQVRSPDGRLERIVRAPGYDLALSGAEIRAERDAWMPDPSEASPVTRALMDVQPDRSHRPAYSDMIVDVYGNVWLREYLGRHERTEPTEWQVFEAEGRWLGSVALPPRLHVFRIGPDWILGKRPGPLDIEHVQLLGLSRATVSVRREEPAVSSSSGMKRS